MSLFTSSHFASAAAQGTDWRDTCKNVLEKLESIRTDKHSFNLGFLYISDHLVQDASSILNIFKSVLGIENWVGGVGMGICATGESFIDTPAISAMIGYFDPEDIHIFTQSTENSAAQERALQVWLKQKDPMLVLLHGDPKMEQAPASGIAEIEKITNGFLTGGLTSSRHRHVQFANGVFEKTLCGVVFSQNVPIATTLSQGCTVVSPVHTITRAEGQMIFELDDQKALKVFENSIRAMVIRKTDIDPDTIMVNQDALLDKTAAPPEFQKLFDTEIHAGLPIPGSDQKEYLVRNIIGMDPENGALAIAQAVSSGDPLIFVHRDNESVYKDLSAQLVALRRRIEHEQGVFAPKGALYISCVARAFSEFDGPANSEMSLIRDIIGDVPLTGFYASGEICKGHLYGYTGILTLFL